jgi:hypothetical protein
MPTGNDTAENQSKLLADIEQTLTAQLELVRQGNTRDIAQHMARLSELLASYDHSQAQVHAAQWERVRLLYRTVVAAAACEFEKTKKDLSRLIQRRGKAAKYFRGQRDFL